MEEVALNQLLARANTLIRSVGVGILHEEQLAAALDLTLTSFKEIFGSKRALFCLVAQRNIDMQRLEHEQLFTHLATALECLLGVLHHSLQEMRGSRNYDYHVVRQHYPEVWQLLQTHLQEYSLPMLTRLLQAAIHEGHLRADLDARLIAHIILSQFGMLIDEQVFPPEHTNLSEVYRSLFFPYVRGLCTEAGLQLTAHHFARV